MKQFMMTKSATTLATHFGLTTLADHVTFVKAIKTDTLSSEEFDAAPNRQGLETRTVS